MRIGETKTLTVDNKTIEAQYIGRGMFCTAYRKDDRVYLYCQGDYSKECVALFCTPGPHIPKIERHNPVEEFQVYSMPFYDRITKAKYPKAWAQWKTLPNVIIGFSRISEYVDSEQNNTPETVRLAIGELIQAYCNYENEGMLCEFNRANIGVDRLTGELILRDCLASRGNIDRVRRQLKSKKRSNYKQ